jgi:hypothetical protein
MSRAAGRPGGAHTRHARRLLDASSFFFGATCVALRSPAPDPTTTTPNHGQTYRPHQALLTVEGDERIVFALARAARDGGRGCTDVGRGRFVVNGRGCYGQLGMCPTEPAQQKRAFTSPTRSTGQAWLGADHGRVGHHVMGRCGASEGVRAHTRPQRAACAPPPPRLAALCPVSLAKKSYALRVPGAVDVQHNAKAGEVLLQQGLGQGGRVYPQAGARAPDGSVHVSPPCRMFWMSRLARRARARPAPVGAGGECAG